MTNAIDIANGRGLSNEARRELLPNKTKVTLYHGCINRSFNSKRRLTGCTLLTRRSASVTKVGVPCWSETFQTRLANSVTVIIAA